ncbi:ribosomal protein S18-alanine N-acetyltransferase [Leifsonia poae]|uniref:ribosomal protein S18-alanine N-acetyltransferase n=1 Tax=Leifsonia poae TaxID=110933 RepID=UPI001CBC8148|nr:ribosomal protein S18-alanine N-acetyltransferase [Leifsonia poae]
MTEEPPTTVWQLRRATVDDVDAIMAIERSTFATDAWSERSMRSEVRSEHTYYLVAFDPEHPERIDAYAGLLAPRGAAEGDIQTIAVAEPARRRGLGRTLMLALVGEARKRGAREVFLEVRADNPGAQTLYGELGFEDIGVRPHYYQPDDVDAIVMRLVVPRPETTTA